MIELKGLADSVMKNSSDKANFNREFQDLQVQLYDMNSVKFNGVTMFAEYSSNANGGRASSTTRLWSRRSAHWRQRRRFERTEGKRRQGHAHFRTDDQCVHPGGFGVQQRSPCNRRRRGESFRSQPAQVGDAINLSDISVGIPACPGRRRPSARTTGRPCPPSASRPRTYPQ